MIGPLSVRSAVRAAPVKAVLNPHGNHSANAGQGVDHQTDERLVTDTGNGSGVDGVEVGAGFVCLEHRHIAASLRTLTPVWAGGSDLNHRDEGALGFAIEIWVFAEPHLPACTRR